MCLAKMSVAQMCLGQIVCGPVMCMAEKSVAQTGVWPKCLGLICLRPKISGQKECGPIVNVAHYYFDCSTRKLFLARLI